MISSTLARPLLYPLIKQQTQTRRTGRSQRDIAKIISTPPRGGSSREERGRNRRVILSDRVREGVEESPEASKRSFASSALPDRWGPFDSFADSLAQGDMGCADSFASNDKRHVTLSEGVRDRVEESPTGTEDIPRLIVAPSLGGSLDSLRSLEMTGGVGRAWLGLVWRRSGSRRYRAAARSAICHTAARMPVLSWMSSPML